MVAIGLRNVLYDYERGGVSTRHMRGDFWRSVRLSCTTPGIHGHGGAGWLTFGADEDLHRSFGKGCVAIKKAFESSECSLSLSDCSFIVL